VHQIISDSLSASKGLAKYLLTPVGKYWRFISRKAGVQQKHPEQSLTRILGSWMRHTFPRLAGLCRKSDPLQELLKSWIGMQGLKERVDL
jgi:hypothetical protein